MILLFLFCSYENAILKKEIPLHLCVYIQEGYEYEIIKPIRP